MTNKFISIILSVILIAGLFPAMSVSASNPDTVLFEADFEAYSSGEVFNEVFAGDIVRAGEEAYYFTLGGAVKAQIVTMPGYDNNAPTQAMKISTKPAAMENSTDGQFRINYQGFTPPTTGIMVTELKVYTPARVNSGGKIVNNDIQRFYASPFVKRDDVFGAGSEISKYEAVAGVNYGGWTKLTYIQNLDTGNISAYVNDEFVGYSVYTNNKTTTTRIQINRRYNDMNTEEHIIFDDFKFYVPSVTTASSGYKDAEEVSVKVNPTIDFSKKLLNTSINGNDTISASNAEVINMSDGSSVSVNELVISSDGKSLMVDIDDVLDYATDYRIRLTGLLDMYGAVIPDYTFSFTTREQPAFSLSEPVFVNEEIGKGTAVTALEKGNIRTSYSVTNNHNTQSKDVFMFAVLKQNGKLQSVQYKKLSLLPLSTNTFNVAFYIDDYENQSIETYVWDSLSGKSALASSYTISADGITSTSAE